ncbi:MAG: hypothetical protein SVX28_12170, partial [Pseudomonadota bacterium]|nr:hypothetical protein [Pseudomonadota bacterium]
GEPWQPLAEDEALVLQDYQLPELLGVHIASGPGSLTLPDGLAPVSNDDPGVAVPVIPDLC